MYLMNGNKYENVKKRLYYLQLNTMAIRKNVTSSFMFIYSFAMYLFTQKRLCEMNDIDYSDPKSLISRINVINVVVFS